MSGSGSNTEGISHFVDEFAKEEVKHLDSWLEDTRHLLQILTEENTSGPQPTSSIPVTLDISGMYSNVPWDDAIKAVVKGCILVSIDIHENLLGFGCSC